MDFDRSGIYRLKGKVQHYDWGGSTFIPFLLNENNPGNRPFAEYWMGAHGENSAEILGNDNKWIRLSQVIGNDPEHTLGPDINKRFRRLPYLFKILDVRNMLSIQVHPEKQAAEIEFKRENAEGIPLNAPNRNYRDNNHKPELLVALSEFWLLHGFKPADEIRDTLSAVPELQELLPVFEGKRYKHLYQYVMQMPASQVNQILKPLLDRIIPLYKENRLEKNHADFWAARAAIEFESMNIDRGIFSVYMFNLVKLKKEQAIFQAAGVPHAYLEGQNLEIMANSDNVLRGGLTTKHIDVSELVKHIKFEGMVPCIIEPKHVDASRQVYESPAEDFEISRISLKNNQVYDYTSVTAEVFIVIEGELTAGAGHIFKTGDAGILFAGCKTQFHSTRNATVYIASVPVHTGE